MQDRFNTAAGWVLFAGIVGLGASVVSGMYFHADSAPELEKPGFFIEGGEEEGGGDAGYDLGTLFAAADAAAGEKVFAKCTACHTINAGGANGIGPNLHGVLGSGIGKHVPGFAYSSDLSAHGGTWTYENMDAWLASPKGFVAGTKMSFAGLGKPEDRVNLMAYLKANGGGPDYPAPAAPAAEEGAEGDAAATVDGTAPVEGQETTDAEAAGATSTEVAPANAQSATENENSIGN